MLTEAASGKTSTQIDSPIAKVSVGDIIRLPATNAGTGMRYGVVLLRAGDDCTIAPVVASGGTPALGSVDVTVDERAARELDRSIRVAVDHVTTVSSARATMIGRIDD